MKKFLLLVLPMVTLAIGSPALAGGKCEYDAQVCLDHMANHFKAKGWAGLELDKTEDGGQLVVTAVVPDSPAAAAGFKAGDILHAVNGIAYGADNDEAMTKMQKTLIPGSEATYTVLRSEDKMDLGVSLASAPEEVVTQWVGHHMLHYHTDFGEAHP